MRFDLVATDKKDIGLEGWILLHLLQDLRTGCLKPPPVGAHVDCFLRTCPESIYKRSKGLITPSSQLSMTVSGHGFTANLDRFLQEVGGPLLLVSPVTSFGFYAVLSDKDATWPEKFERMEEKRESVLKRTLQDRFPTKTEEWVAQAVASYRQFLDLQVGALQAKSDAFSPSVEIDKIWHVHLSFHEEYVQDCLEWYGMIVPHRPVIDDDVCKRGYARAFELRFQKGGTIAVDFWPLPGNKRKRDEGALSLCEGEEDEDCAGCGCG